MKKDVSSAKIIDGRDIFKRLGYHYSIISRMVNKNWQTNDDVDVTQSR